MKRIFICIMALALVPLAHAAPAHPLPPSIDPAAIARLDQSAKAYAALTSVSMQFVSSSQFSIHYETSSGTLTLAQPDKARLELMENGSEEFALSDGQKFVELIDDDKYGVSKIIPDPRLKLVHRVLENMPYGVKDILGDLAVGQNPLKLEDNSWEKASLLPDNGVALKHKTSPHYSDTVLQLYFDPSDHLLRRLEARLTWRGRTAQTITTFTNVQLNPPLSPDTFNFTAPPDSEMVVKPVIKAPVLRPRYAHKYDPRLKVGTAPFPLTGRDLGGNQYPWSRYKGKVVLLDFWASWCGPCIKEVPNVVQNLKKYQGSGFRVLGVSLDKSKTDLQKFTKARHLPYPNLFDAKGWENPDAQRYGVHSIPFTLLIGKDGKIAAVNPRGPTLEPAIQKALQTK